MRQTDSLNRMGWLKSTLRSVLAHPLTRGVDIDDPRATVLRKTIIERKPFLRRIYNEWYGLLANDLPAGQGTVLELGSGAGFLDRFVPGLITSDVFLCPGIRAVLDAQRMPFADSSLRGIVMTNVFHHIPNVRLFLAEATRTVRPGGVIAMIEPWNTLWARFVCNELHHEDFQPDAPRWDFEMRGPLSGSNHALPWIVFHRDRAQFEREFPQWKIQTLRPFMALRYIVSGGVSMRAIAPGFAYPIIKAVDDLAGEKMAMFCHIVLRRVES